jgi:RNA recognition motif-containing protein
LFNDILIKGSVCYLLIPRERNIMKLREINNIYKEAEMQSNKLYVGNFSYSVTDEQLEKLFAPFGPVKQANVIGNKGFGFVEMSNVADAEKAKDALNGTTFEGRTIRVDEARPQKDRPQRNFGKRY